MDKLTAYHESGHAIAATVAGGNVVHVSVINEDENLAGDTRVKWPNSAATEKEHAFREIRVSLAGPVCEMIYAGEYDGLRIKSEHAMDWKMALDSVAMLTGNPEKQIALLSQEASNMYEFFRTDHAWAAVSDLADQLLTHEFVERATIDEIVAQWIR